MTSLFEIRNLSVAIYDQDVAHAGVEHDFRDVMTDRPLGPGWVPGVRNVSLSVRRGEVVSLVGESGMGKTLIVMAALGLLSPTARVTAGEVWMNGERFDVGRLPVPDASRKGRRAMRKRRWLGEVDDPVYARIMGNEIGVIYQDPVASWNPVPLIGEQAGEALAQHTDMSADEIQQRVYDVLGEVKLPKASKFFSFRHELSRGEAQRAMLASALINGPSLLVADEPFTGLDPPVAQGIAELIRDMQRRRGLGMIMVNHDLAQVASLSDRVAVVYGGRIIEDAPVGELYRRPRHPYTEGLLGSVPWRGVDRLRSIAGETPRLADVSQHACSFADRCEYATEECRSKVPKIRRTDGRAVACVRAEVLDLQGVPQQ